MSSVTAAPRDAWGSAVEAEAQAWAVAEKAEPTEADEPAAHEDSDATPKADEDEVRADRASDLVQA